MSDKRSVSGKKCMAMDIPEKGRFYLNNYWIQDDYMKAMLSLNIVDREEVELIEKNSLFNQKPFVFNRTTKPYSEKATLPGEPSDNKPNVNVSGVYESECFIDSSSVFTDIPVARKTIIDLSSNKKIDEFFLTTSKVTDLRSSSGKTFKKTNNRCRL